MSVDIESILKEGRVFPPPPEFARAAHVGSLDDYRALYQRSLSDPEGFWAEQADTLLWRKKWDRVLDWQPPFAKWFPGGQLNVAENCLDRHVKTWRRNKAALVWEGEPGEVRTLTYQQLLGEVCRFANVLKGLGVQKGDRVGIYMPLVPEAAVAMLGCARIGATHSVVFGGFSAEALRDRMNDAQARVMVTAVGGYRRGAVVPLKANVDLALADMPAYILATREDHIVPWRTAFASTHLLGGRIEFVLSASGHIAGVINPASKNRRNFWVNPAQEPDPGRWLAEAASRPGSWWAHWADWLAGFGGERVPARQPGGNGYREIEPAPGRYVKVRFDKP